MDRKMDSSKRQVVNPRTAVEETYELLQNAHGDYHDALAIFADTGRSSDGALALRQRSQEYARAVTRYSEAVMAWLAYIDTNREETLKLLWAGNDVQRMTPYQ